MSGFDDFWSGGSPFDSFNIDTGSIAPSSSNIGDVFSGFSAGPASGLSGLWDNLTGQFKNIGQNVINNPLGALAAGLGAYGSYRENTGGKIPEGTLDAVQQLMLKGDAQNAYTPQPVKYNQPVARDWRHFKQSFDLDGNATNTSRNQALTNEAYQKILGRDADVGGMKFWSGNMDNHGMDRAEMERELFLSPERSVKDAYKDVLGRQPDFNGKHYWMQRIAAGARPDEVRAAMGGSVENGINSLYREELGRTGDLLGVEFYRDALNRGMTMDQLRQELRNSPEAKARQPAPAAPATGGLAAANPAPGVPTAVAPRPGKIFPDDGMYNYHLE